MLAIFLYLSMVFAFANCADPKIVGGKNATLTEYVVSIRLIPYEQLGFGRGHICGGTLIQEYSNVVVTAAHCLFESPEALAKRPASQLRVVTGNINKTVNDANTVIRNVKKFIIHENYRHTIDFQHDIALLILSEPITSGLHPNVKPVQLTTYARSEGTPCTIKGWGMTDLKGTIPNLLQLANVSIISTQFCNSSKSYRGLIKDGMICAGYIQGLIDSCQGDSGGPLVCDNYLVGVTSNGHECAFPNFPGIYTDVIKYRPWIISTAKKNSAASLAKISLFLLISVVMLKYFL